MTAHRHAELARTVARCRARITLASGLDSREQALADAAADALAALHVALDKPAHAPMPGQLDLDLRTRLIERRRA